MTQTPPGFGPSDNRRPYDAKPDPEFMEEVRGLSSGQIEGLRLRARKDRYFLARGVLGYRDVNPYTHGPLCRALEVREKKRRMFLMPRATLKTTLATVTDCVGDALDDPDECRILILNEVEQNAIGFLSEIKAHFEHNELLLEWFPEILPQRTGGPGSRWSTDKACLNRKTSYKEWTWTAAGIGSAKTGNHYGKIKCDDIIGFEASKSPAAMVYAIAYAKSLEPLLIDMDEDYIDFVGTRWGLFDLYREMLKAYGDEMLYFAREDIEVVPEMSTEALRMACFDWQGKGKPPLDDVSLRAKIGTQQSIFPRKLSLKKLSRLATIDPVLYYAQYKNSPISDGIKDFSTDKLRYFDFDDFGNIVYRDDRGLIQRWSRESLDIVMTCDPNGGDLTAQDLAAIVVTAQSPKQQVFALDSWARRVQPDAYIEQIFDMWSRWQPRVVGIEKAAAQSLMFWFKRFEKERGYGISVEPLTPKNREKPIRIRRTLQPMINLGRLYLRRSQASLIRQIQFHPDLENDDELDALAYGADLWRTPLTFQELAEEEDAVQVIMRRRSALTGYGA